MTYNGTLTILWVPKRIWTSKHGVEGLKILTPLFSYISQNYKKINFSTNILRELFYFYIPHYTITFNQTFHCKVTHPFQKAPTSTLLCFATGNA